MDTMPATVTLFQGALGSFEGVRIARSFDQDFTTSQLKLDIVQLRLSRWGEVVGLTHDPTTAITATTDADSEKVLVAGSNEGSNTPQIKNLELVTRVLVQVQDLFDQASRRSARMKMQTRVGTNASTPGDEISNFDSVYDPKKDMDRCSQRVRGKLRAWVDLRRVGTAHTGQQVQWAMYKKEQFDTFISSLLRLLDELEEAFPPEQEEMARNRLKELSAAECATMEDTYLDELVYIEPGECDQWLEEAAKSELAKKREKREKQKEKKKAGTNNDLSHITLTSRDNNGVQIGGNTGTVTIRDFRSGGGQNDVIFWSLELGLLACKV